MTCCPSSSYLRCQPVNPSAGPHALAAASGHRVSLSSSRSPGPVSLTFGRWLCPFRSAHISREPHQGEEDLTDRYRQEILKSSGKGL